MLIAQADSAEQKNIAKADLFAVLSARSEEFLTIMLEEIEQHRLRVFTPAGLVITGRGSLLAGIAMQASRILHMPVRTGRSVLMEGVPTLLQHPSYATSYGLFVRSLVDEKA